MPLPAILGLGALAGFLGSLASKAVEFVVERVSRRVIVRVVYVGIVSGMMLVLASLLHSLIAGLTFVLPAEYSTILVRVLPFHTSTCLSIVISSTIARRIYDMKVKTATYTWLGI